MSMYRQLWLAIIITTLLALGGSLLASLLSVRGYVEEQLSVKNTDNANSLALSISQQNPDAATIDLTVSALFDSGHYELIRVTDPFGKTLTERHAPESIADVPDWFVRLLPIHAKPGQAQISSGWKQVGTVYLASQSRYAYQALWKSSQQIFVSLLLAGFIGGYLGSLILRRLKEPLQAVIEQAEAIMGRRFVTIPEPKVPELRRLAVAMNDTVARLKAMFDEEALRLNEVRREANFDPLTSLANRGFFMARLEDALENEESASGTLMLVRIADLAGINQRLGRAATDELLRRLAKATATFAEQHGDGLAARLNGADFAVLLPPQTQAKKSAEELLETLGHEALPYLGNATVGFIGVGHFSHGIEKGCLLSQVDAALASAQATGSNTVHEAAIAGDTEMPQSAEQWAQQIKHALDNRWLRLISFPVNDFRGQLIHWECPLRLRLEEDGEWLPAGRFLPMAERLHLTSSLDLAAARLGIEELEKHPELPGLAINLSASSIHEAEFRTQLQDLLKGHLLAASKLWLEIAEVGAFKHLEDFRQFVDAVAPTGCRLGLEHFGRQFSQIGHLHDLGLDYLKVDASFIRDLDHNPGNQSFLKGLSTISHGIGLQVIGEGVMNDAELNTLPTLGFDGATGPAVKAPA